VSLFVNGKSDVSTALAKKLELSTGITASFWLNIQKRR
jgi:plasmid maintenance system antidote protein VapI